MRIAIYYAPESTSPFGKAAAEWLKEEDGKIPGLSDKEVHSLLAAPKHYGFHGTIKPPFRLKSGYRLEDVEHTLSEFMAEKQNRSFDMPRLKVTKIGSFFCLKPATESEQLYRLAAETLQRFDHFRKPAEKEEIERRRAAGLTPRQDQLLLEWGYPYVLDQFNFHFTLTGNVQNPKHFIPINQELEKRFRSLSQSPISFDCLKLFIQNGENPFVEYNSYYFE